MSYYAEHVIRSSTRGEGIAFWLFARPKSSMYLAEVAVTPSSIMISGDGPDLHQRIAADADDERGLIDAVEAAGCADTPEQFITALYDAGVNCPWEYSMGVAPSRDLVQAREMVAALLDRIDEGGEA